VGCGGAGAGAAPPSSAAGASPPEERASLTFNDYRGTWQGLVQLGPHQDDLRALLLVVGQESELCERPAYGCVPAEVRVEAGHLAFRVEEGDEVLEGRLVREAAPIVRGSVRSSACGCEGEARLDRVEEDESFEGAWTATISFDPRHTQESGALPAPFRSPEPFVLHVRASGAEACGPGAGPCVHVEWVPQGPQAAFHFESVVDGVRITTEGHVGRASNGHVTGEIRRAGGENERRGRIFLRPERTRSL
jgi:hypothetical protein